RFDGNQPSRGLVEAREPVLVRHVAEHAVEAVGPAVVAAHECLAATRAGRQLRAAVPARVAERPHPTIAPAHREDRRPCGVAYDPLSGSAAEGQKGVGYLRSTSASSAAYRSSER